MNLIPVSQPNLMSPSCFIDVTAVACPDQQNLEVVNRKREQLVLDHMPLVRMVARVVAKRLPQHIDLEDLISAGTVGLLEAAERFEEAKHAQFGTFAQFRIRGAILDSLRSLDWSPRTLRRQARLIAAATSALAQRLGRTPTQSEIAAELGLNLASYQQTLGQIEALQVEDLYAGGDEDVDTAYLEIPASPDSDPLALCIQGQTRQQLITALQDLSERERLVLTLLCYEGMTMREVGLTLGVVESRVSQIRTSSLKRLQRIFANGLQVTETSRTGRKCRKDNPVEK